MASARIHEAIAKEINKDYNMDELFELIAPCHFGLESVLKKEIQDLILDLTEKKTSLKNIGELRFDTWDAAGKRKKEAAKRTHGLCRRTG